MDLDAGKVAIFKNDKQGNESRPDYTGELATPGGEKLRISLWLNESKGGVKYLGGNVQAPQQNGGGQTTTADAVQAAAGARATPDSDIPFAASLI